MERVGKFYKVSFEQFAADYKNIYPGFSDDRLREIYDEIELPKRSTVDSAGYDFHSTVATVLETGDTVHIPTGIRCKIKPGWFLQMVPRSGMGFKHRAQLDNTVGIIDGDYFYTDNEGHIQVKMTKDSKGANTGELPIEVGARVCQGIFLPYGITEDDDTTSTREGGFGSTGV